METGSYFHVELLQSSGPVFVTGRAHAMEVCMKGYVHVEPLQMTDRALIMVMEHGTTTEFHAASS